MSSRPVKQLMGCAKLFSILSYFDAHPATAKPTRPHAATARRDLPSTPDPPWSIEASSTERSPMLDVTLRERVARVKPADLLFVREGSARLDRYERRRHSVRTGGHRPCGKNSRRQGTAWRSCSTSPCLTS